MKITSKMTVLLFSATFPLFAFISDAGAQACVVPPSGLVSWWPLDETSGTTTADIVDSNPGTVVTGASFVTGKVGNALEFNGAGGRVEIANNANLSPDNQITLEAWVKPDVLSGLREIYRRDIDGNRILFSFQSGGVFCSDAGSLVPVASPCLAFGINTAASPAGLGYKEFEVGGLDALTDGAFHHVAATYDGAFRKIYIDGGLAGSVADTGPIGKTGATLAYIGSVGASEFFDGIIDELGIYDRALTASEILAIFNADTAGKCKVTVEIDIKPGSDPNAVNPRSKGVIPVAVLGSGDFDAALVDFSTVVFGPGGASPVHDGHVENVNGDGFVDIVFHFKGAGIACGDTDATLTGATFGAVSIGGTDAVKTAGCN